MKMKLLHDQPDVQKLISIIEADGPEEYEYEELTSIWNGLKVEKESTTADVLTSKQLIHLFGDQFLSETIHGFSYRKPHGYAGDFQVIDYIYQQKINDNKRFQKWDKYFQAQHAAQAVRNRKNYFISVLRKKVSECKKAFRVLNIASGPCRDVLEFFEQLPPDKMNIHMHCVDIDTDAINYAKKLLERFIDSVTFTRRNIFKFETAEKFDLIWSGGLFDYFNDDDFKKLLSKLYACCASPAEIIIGNFSISNPTRAYMEKGLEWYLFHRTREQLKGIALKAGIKDEQIRIRSEFLGVNLFLHIRVP